MTSNIPGLVDANREGHMIFKCRKCGHTVRRTFHFAVRRSVFAESWTCHEFYKSNGGVVPDHLCPQCGRQTRGKLVAGKFSAAHVCDSRCINATGPNCECQCGGENHGGAYA